jgi:hypothetical protein
VIQPPDDATALSEPESVELNDLEKATIEFETERQPTDLHLYSLAASKRPSTTYTVKIDDRRIWGPARFPPVDIDDKQVVWMPPERAAQTLTVEIANLRNDGTTRQYDVLPLGWESQ